MQKKNPRNSESSSAQISESGNNSEPVDIIEEFGFDPFDGSCLNNPDFRNKRGRSKIPSSLLVFEIVIMNQPQSNEINSQLLNKRSGIIENIKGISRSGVKFVFLAQSIPLLKSIRNDDKFNPDKFLLKKTDQEGLKSEIKQIVNDIAAENEKIRSVFSAYVGSLLAESDFSKESDEFIFEKFIDTSSYFASVDTVDDDEEEEEEDDEEEVAKQEETNGNVDEEDEESKSQEKVDSGDEEYIERPVKSKRGRKKKVQSEEKREQQQQQQQQPPRRRGRPRKYERKETEETEEEAVQVESERSGGEEGEEEESSSKERSSGDGKSGLDEEEEEEENSSSEKSGKSPVISGEEDEEEEEGADDDEEKDREEEDEEGGSKESYNEDESSQPSKIVDEDDDEEEEEEEEEEEYTSRTRYSSKAQQASKKPPLEEEQEEQKPRKRGRPPKAETIARREEELRKKQQEEEASGKEQKKRGRKPKYNKAAEKQKEKEFDMNEKIDDAKQAVVEKPKRGRPKKNPQPAIVEEKQEPKNSRHQKARSESSEEVKVESSDGEPEIIENDDSLIQPEKATYNNNGQMIPEQRQQGGEYNNNNNNNQYYQQQMGQYPTQQQQINEVEQQNQQEQQQQMFPNSKSPLFQIYQKVNFISDMLFKKGRQIEIKGFNHGGGDGNDSLFSDDSNNFDFVTGKKRKRNFEDELFDEYIEGLTDKVEEQSLKGSLIFKNVLTNPEVAGRIKNLRFNADRAELCMPIMKKLKKSETKVLSAGFINNSAGNLVNNITIDSNEILLEYKYKAPGGRQKSIEIYAKDIEKLDPEVYINDTLISFYLHFVYNDLLTPAQKDNVYIFNTYLLQKLKAARKEPFSEADFEKQYTSVKKWTKDVNLFEKEYIVFPHHDEQQDHWNVFIACFPGAMLEPNYENPDDSNASTTPQKPFIIYMDSFGMIDHSIAKLISLYLKYELKHKQPEIYNRVVPELNMITEDRFHQIIVPLQENFSDCGLHVLENVERFLTDPDEIIDSLEDKDMLGKFPLDSYQTKRNDIKKLIFGLSQGKREVIDEYKTEREEKYNDALENPDDNFYYISDDELADFLKNKYNASYDELDAITKDRVKLTYYLQNQEIKLAKTKLPGMNGYY